MIVSWVVGFLNGCGTWAWDQGLTVKVESRLLEGKANEGTPEQPAAVVRDAQRSVVETFQVGALQNLSAFFTLSLTLLSVSLYVSCTEKRKMESQM